MAVNGSAVMVFVNTGTVAVPVWTKLGCQRDATIDEKSDTIDVSCKDSRAQQVLAGRYSSSVSLDTLYIPDDAAYLALQAANRAGTLVGLQRQEQGVAIANALAKVDSLSESFPDQGEAVVSCSFTVDNFWVAVP